MSIISRQSDLDYADDAFWDSLATRPRDELEDLLEEAKQELSDIEDEQVELRTEWDAYAIQLRPPQEYREAYAEYRAARADLYFERKLVSKRKNQIASALRDSVGDDPSADTARTLIERLTRGIKQFEAGEIDMADLIGELDRSWLLANGVRMNLSELHAGGFRW